jgi:hypothetical protein
MLNPDLAFDDFWQYFFLKHSYSSNFFAQTGIAFFLGVSFRMVYWKFFIGSGVGRELWLW